MSGAQPQPRWLAAPRAFPLSVAVRLWGTWSSCRLPLSLAPRSPSFRPRQPEPASCQGHTHNRNVVFHTSVPFSKGVRACALTRGRGLKPPSKPSLACPARRTPQSRLCARASKMNRQRCARRRRSSYSGSRRQRRRARLRRRSKPGPREGVPGSLLATIVCLTVGAYLTNLILVRRKGV